MEIIKKEELEALGIFTTYPLYNYEIFQEEIEEIEIAGWIKKLPLEEKIYGLLEEGTYNSKVLREKITSNKNLDDAIDFVWEKIYANKHFDLDDSEELKRKHTIVMLFVFEKMFYYKNSKKLLRMGKNNKENNALHKPISGMVFGALEKTKFLCYYPEEESAFCENLNGKTFKIKIDELWEITTNALLQILKETKENKEIDNSLLLQQEANVRIILLMIDVTYEKSFIIDYRLRTDASILVYDAISKKQFVIKFNELWDDYKKII